MPDYVRGIRQLIGDELLLMPGVIVLARDAEGRLLLVRHAETGLWGLVGGYVEVDEQPADAAIREAAEETGVEVELTGLITALGGPGFRVQYANGHRTSVVVIVYEARVIDGIARPDNDETSQVGWFCPEELPALELGPLAQSTLEHLDWLRTPAIVPPPAANASAPHG
jgi:ADP-ribose pyrophosphatase YjhB (NUDIX family)